MTRTTAVTHSFTHLARLDHSGERCVGRHAAIEPRLIVESALGKPLSLADERAHGTYGPRRTDSVLDELRAAGLRGKGGAGFPAHVKWASVAQASGDKVVVANGEEGEPFSRKDRWLLTHRPHLVIDGVLSACETVGAGRALLYLSHDETVDAVRRALGELSSAGSLPGWLRLDVHVVPPTYVAGEESAVCRSINGGPALPTAKPPRPFEQGVDAQPTLVSNVETLAHAAWIARHGAEEYRRYGTPDSPGTTLMTVNGACHRPGVYEVPFGVRLRDIFALAGGFTSQPTALMMGGWFSGLADISLLDSPCTLEDLRAADTGFGCGSITVLGADDDPLAVAAEIADWYSRESAQQCGVCIKGTAAIRNSLAALRDDRSLETEVHKLSRWGTSLIGRGACSFLDGAAAWARTTSQIALNGRSDTQSDEDRQPR